MSLFDAVKKYLLYVLLCASPLIVQAQQFRPEIQDYLRSVKSQWRFTDLDMVSWSASDQYSNAATGITYTYLQQEVAGIRIFNAVSTMAIRDGKVAHFASRFVSDAASKANAQIPYVTPEQAIIAAAAYLRVPITQTPAGSLKDETRQQWVFNTCGIASQPITVELFYVKVDNTLRLAWNVNIDMRTTADWWNIRIDAQTGAFIEKNNWTVSCDFEKAEKAGDFKPTVKSTADKTANTVVSGATYNVFPLPVEAPNFGPREILTDPFSVQASPFGWHDTDGVDGPEFTITRGNNVNAYEDEDDDNQPGYSPDGGPDLHFDFPLNFDYDLDTNRNAIIANLFYMNNIIHDILYIHGFDELAGNFQENNYDNGGEDGDYVRAEAQDGGGLNNANFSTPDDGSRPRMQMYLWNNSRPSFLKINTPVLLNNQFDAPEATFSPDIPAPFSGKLVLVNDGIGDPTDACEAILNPADLLGNIAVMNRTSSCTFISQVNAAEMAGAIAVILCNNILSNPYSINEPGSTTIPGLLISKINGDSLKAHLAAGIEVNGTIHPRFKIDGSLDNGIVAHEFGHGLSNRLTGGPSNSGCLGNGEQGGEGWSDWLALILTIEPNDVSSNPRGIGTFALSEPVLGPGIRRFPYSTNMSVNAQNYDDMASNTQVHAIGEIWAQTLWDLTWKLIDAEGFDPDWFNGTSGNNVAMRLVIEGMKLQPCLPGYLDARDGILAADALLYNNAHRCIIWEAFAGRGMGFDAVQGSSADATDQIAGYDIPNFCKTPVAPPTANFGVDIVESCLSTFTFNDLSTDLPQYWAWDFGDGSTSDAQSPTHIYTVPGSYTVVLTVTNSLGVSNHSQIISYFLEPAPTVSGNTTVCAGNATTLTAGVQQGYTANWFANGVLLGTGTSFTTANLVNTTTFAVRQFDNIPNGKVGPSTNTIGNGGNQSSGPEGRLLFEAIEPFFLKTAFVYAKNAGNRTFKLYNENNEVIQTVTVAVPDGPSRITLNMIIPAPGKYSIGNAAQNLYRNFGGVSYPYTIDNVVRIYQSNYAANPTGFYFYLYDWEVTFCFSAPAPVTVNVTPGPVANFVAGINDLTAQFSNITSGAASSFSWNFGDGSPVSGQLNPTHTYAAAGTYTVLLTVSNGTCSSSYEQIIVVGSSGVTDLTEESGMRVFPNPATDEVNIEFVKAFAGNALIEVSDETGRIVITQKMVPAAKQAQLRTGNLAAGVYYVRVKGDDGIAVRKITVIGK